jgi:predicted O-methyltransferase YrrM
MVNTIEYVGKKFELDLNQKPPINILKTNRTIVAQTLAELGFTVGAEIGVADGKHAEILCKNIPELKLYCVDIWESYPDYIEYVERIDRYYRMALRRLQPYNCVFVKKFSMDAIKDFEPESLDFVYIDGAHDFKNVAMDICEWSKKVKVGGIIYGHDYKRRHNKYTIEVKDVVQAYAYAKELRPWFVLGMPGNRNDGMYCEGVQSWMYVRTETDKVFSI